MRHSYFLSALVIIVSPTLLWAQAPQSGQPAAPANAPRPALEISDDLTGWTPMFDGVSLNGWDGPMPLWHVEDGAIVVRSVEEPPTGSVYLIWQGGQPADFEMKLDVKLGGEGANSGVQFRAMLLGEVPDRPMTRWESHGYQADMTNSGASSGNLLNCCRGPGRGPARRDDATAARGQVARTDGEKQLIATLEDADTLRGYWRPNDWNQIHIIAQGRTLMYILNGHLASVLIDNHPELFRDSGYIAIQLEGRGANEAMFKNLWFKELTQ